MAQTYLMLLWHMHQPFYKDLAEGEYTMPWVRLHAWKDYYGMVAMLRDFPAVHVTFNLVPSLVVQIEEYARETAKERAYQVAFKPVVDLTMPERALLLASAFQVNRDNLLNRYPRFRELWVKSRATDAPTAARIFTAQELLDLQVLSQLAWVDEIYLALDPEIRRLVKKERGYSEDDKSCLHSGVVKLLNEVLQEYRKAQERGQIEIATSPFYHPILPLLCDSNAAGESHSGIKLPKRRFVHPEDARDQLRTAADLHQRVFGRRPRGLWPSEGGVSDEALRLAVEEGFEWVASDEGILERTLQTTFHRRADGSVDGGGELYRPHRLASGDRTLAIFFRDRQLSDLIGFVYSRLDPQTAAADLHQRIRGAGRGVAGRSAVVSVILDGENAWEYYPGNGREFLKSFYSRLGADQEIRAVTASEALNVVQSGSLGHLVPGSWINANFDIWIGADEDNRAWDLLTDARDFYAANFRRPGIDPAKVQLAQQEVWVAEGSDWCWWYGPEHSTDNDEQFDLLFRKHVSNIYRLLGGSPADELAVPIKRPRARAVTVAPSARIEPQIDGQVTTYFEWLGAGLYMPDVRSGSMHGAAQLLEGLYYGYSDRALYLRVDLAESFTKGHPEFEVRVNVVGAGSGRLHVGVGSGGIRTLAFWRGDERVALTGVAEKQLQAAFGRVFELRLDYRLLGITRLERIRLQVSVWADELPLQIIPQEGWLTLELTEDLSSW
jgi:alpha-amylase/alpha-mannosidase (GH57 family)